MNPLALRPRSAVSLGAPGSDTVLYFTQRSELRKSGFSYYRRRYVALNSEPKSAARSEVHTVKLLDDEDYEEIVPLFKPGYVTLLTLGLFRELMYGSPEHAGGPRFIRNYWDLPDSTVVCLDKDDVRIWRVQ